MASEVLARKYRPQIFADLVGQDVLVQTITNAIHNNKLAHAYMLTGIRGIGKTSSARIIAKGLNCIGPDGTGGMTPNPCGVCAHCKAITEDSHLDVIEIDAASNTGVDNIREIIEGAKYNPVSARFKIYIIDEVHMLSKQAFNALLKTLEEPPERIKFILATTEIQKVPVTILSRCQRFDLKRLDETLLSKHLSNIVAKENRTANMDALHLIAKASEGSVRDSLSLLDQALTQFTENLTLENIQSMLGLADKTALFDLYQSALSGNMPLTFANLEKQYACGADAFSLANDMLNLTHWLTKAILIPDLLKDDTLTSTEKEFAKNIIPNLSIATLSRVWQLLLKGVGEIKTADNPYKAFEMVLVRLAYMSTLPSPINIIEEIKKKGNIAYSAPPTEPSKQNLAVSDFTPHSIQDIIQKAKQEKLYILVHNLENYCHINSIENNHIDCDLQKETPKTFIPDLKEFLKEKTGQFWNITFKITNTTNTTIAFQKKLAENEKLKKLKQNAIINAIFAQFPGAKIASIRAKNSFIAIEESFASNEE